ncbi:MAG: HAMP domain-containing sensor histidine kinase [Coriobacteriia bacterium]|nr:HAMP domain-containing sensor histidine kinase [Coriobacteriia bacterium]
MDSQQQPQEKPVERELVSATEPVRQPHADPAPDGEASKKGRKKKRGFTYIARLTLLFAAIAIMTALISIAGLSFVWDQHFRTYTQENMQATAESTADRIATQHKMYGEWTVEVIIPAAYTSIAYPDVCIRVVDRDGTVQYDSTQQEERSAAGKVLEAVLPDQMVTAPVIVDDQVVGSVRMWVTGSDSMLRDSDIQFRDSLYWAVVAAALFAVVLACLIGFVFARSLVRPINTMTKTAKAISDGDLSARTGLTGEDEVLKLGEAFDAMAESMEKDRNLERRLTTDVAHELRTPLMAIQSTVEAIQDGVFEADEEHLGTINSEVRRLGRLVDSLLKLSRLENRTTPLKQEIVDVGDLVSTIVSTHESFVNDSGLTLSYDATPNVVVKGDPDMIRQATANLISNAVRYTPEGGHIWVRVRKGEIMASISVEDTGIGLTPEEAKMVFSRFWRAEAGRNRESGGLGIGLSVVNEIVKRHGGWVQVEGKKGEGARFTIHLPLYDRKAEEERRRQQQKGLSIKLPRVKK